MAITNRHAQVALDSIGNAVAYALECPEKRQYCHDALKCGVPSTCICFQGFEMTQDEAWVRCTKTDSPDMDGA